MIIRLTKANFSSNNIGQYTTEPGTLTFNVSPSNASWTLTCAAMSPSTKTGTGNTTWANIPAGSTVSYEVSLSGYNTQKGSISIYGNTSKTITLSEVGSVTPPVTPEEPGTGGGSGETPSVPTTTTWYVDHRNNSAVLTSTVNKAGRGWCHEVGTPAYNAYVGKPVNTVSFFTKLASQEVTVMVGATNSSEENCRLIGTYTATNPKGTSKGLATITFPAVTLEQGEHLILFAQSNDAIDFYYATKEVTDANGLADTGFHGRVPKVYGTGTAWQKMSQSGTYSLGWSIGYVI